MNHGAYDKKSLLNVLNLVGVTFRPKYEVCVFIFGFTVGGVVETESPFEVANKRFS